MAAVLQVGPLALRTASGAPAAGEWCALLSVGDSGEEVEGGGGGARASFDVRAPGAAGQGAVDVHVYCCAGADRTLLGGARVSLAELGLLADGNGTADALSQGLSRRTTWVALRRRERCTGAVQLSAALLPAGADEPPASAVQVHRSYEAMASARQLSAWEWERGDARRELVDLVRRGGIPAARRAQAWLSVSGARHKKHAAEADAYAQWVARLRAGAWREDHALSTQLHTIKKDMPRTFPDDNIYANTAQGKRTLECVLGAACLHNRQSNPGGGYCQGLNSVAACLLTYLSDVDTFWMLEHIQESLCIGYYTDTMVMVNVDVAVVDDIVAEMLPAAHAALRMVEASDFFNPMHVHVPKWLIPLFATELPPTTLFRLWDIIFTEGSHVLVCASAAVIETISEQLEALTSPQAVAAGGSHAQFSSIAVGCGSSDRRVEQVQELFRLVRQPHTFPIFSSHF
jgi:hypothetical protein